MAYLITSLVGAPEDGFWRRMTALVFIFLDYMSVSGVVCPLGTFSASATRSSGKCVKVHNGKKSQRWWRFGRFGLKSGATVGSSVKLGDKTTAGR